MNPLIVALILWGSGAVDRRPPRILPKIVIPPLRPSAVPIPARGIYAVPEAYVPAPMYVGPVYVPPPAPPGVPPLPAVVVPAPPTKVYAKRVPAEAKAYIPPLVLRERGLY